MKQKQFDKIQVGDIVTHEMFPWTQSVVVQKDNRIGGWHVARVNEEGIADHHRMSSPKEWVLLSKITGRKNVIS
jgi:hypothetical protein